MPSSSGLLLLNEAGPYSAPFSGTYRAWLPTDLGTALVAWWDAGQGVTQSGGNVTQWADVVSGLAATGASGSQPTYSATARNSKPGLTFAGSQILTFTPSAGFPSGSSTAAVAVAAYSGAASGASTESYVFAYGASNTGQGLSRLIAQQKATGGSPANGIQYDLAANAEQVYAQPVWNGNDRFVVAQSTGPTAGQITTDGSNDTTGTVVTTNVQTTTGSIGQWPYYGLGWTGVVQQVLVICRALTVAERQKLEGWESWYDGKAGANLPDGHPYKLAAPVVTLLSAGNRLGTPLDAPSGAVPRYYFDPSNTATQTLDANGNYASRTDISGNNVVATCPDANTAFRPTPAAFGISGLPSISYRGVQGYDQVATSVTGNTLTAIVVLQPISSPSYTSAYARFMSMTPLGVPDNSGTQGFDVELNGGANQLYANQAGTITPIYSFTDNAPLILEVLFDGANCYLYISGNLIGSFAASSTFGIARSSFGASTTPDQGWAGLQGAQLLYPTALSTADRQYIEGALAWKWDGGGAGPGPLVNQLPAGHPYKTAAPTAASGTSTPTAATGSASGAATATATGGSTATASGAGSAAGTATASGIAGAYGAATGSSSGAASASATGRTLSGATGAAAGSGTATGAGRALSAASGVAAGTATAFATAGASGIATGSASGAGTATGAGGALVSGIGTASGVATATAAGSALSGATGTVAGSSAASATAGGSGVATGTASGAGAAAATGVALIGATGTAAGSSTVAATAGTRAGATGSSAGASTAFGVGAANDNATGTASGSGAANAVGGSLVQATGTASGSAAVNGTSGGAATAAGTAAGAASVTGAAASRVGATGLSAGTSTASGLASNSSGGTGAASGAGSATAVGATRVGATGIASGASTTTAGSGYGLGGSGTASGAATASGIAGETAAATGSASGAGAATAAGQGRVAAAGIAAGASSAAATGGLSVGAAGAAAGVATATGKGPGSIVAVGGAGSCLGFATVAGVSAFVLGAAQIAQTGVFTDAVTIDGAWNDNITQSGSFSDTITLTGRYA